MGKEHPVEKNFDEKVGKKVKKRQFFFYSFHGCLKAKF